MDIAAVAHPLSSQLATDSVARGRSADSNDQAFERARDLTAQQQRGASTLVNLSAQGEAKSAVADVQNAGRKLAGVARTGAVADLRDAAAGMVDAYNKADRALANAAPADRSETGRGDELREVAEAAATLAEMQKIGVSRTETGALSLATTVLDTALATNPGETRSIAARIGETLQTAASRQLAVNAGSQPSANPAEQASRTRETQRTPQPEQAAAARRSEEQESRRITNAVTGGVAAYQKILGS